jgi:hypothetical protein
MSPFQHNKHRQDHASQYYTFEFVAYPYRPKREQEVAHALLMLKGSALAGPCPRPEMIALPIPNQEGVRLPAFAEFEHLTRVEQSGVSGLMSLKRVGDTLVRVDGRGKKRVIGAY